MFISGGEGVEDLGGFSPWGCFPLGIAREGILRISSAAGGEGSMEKQGCSIPEFLLIPGVLGKEQPRGSSGAVANFGGFNNGP